MHKDLGKIIKSITFLVNKNDIQQWMVVFDCRTVLGALVLVVIYSTYNSSAQYHSSGMSYFKVGTSLM